MSDLSVRGATQPRKSPESRGFRPPRAPRAMRDGERGARPPAAREQVVRLVVEADRGSPNGSPADKAGDVEPGVVEDPLDRGEDKLRSFASPKSSRLRARAVWVNRLEHVLSGGKTSSGAVSAWFSELFQSGVELVSSERVAGVGSGGKIVLLDNMLVVRNGGVETKVSMEIYAALHSYVVYRPREKSLLGVLRSRAKTLAKEIGLSRAYLATVMAGTVALAHLVSCNERAGWRFLGGDAGVLADEHTDALESGSVDVVPELAAASGLEVAYSFPEELTWGRLLRGSL